MELSSFWPSTTSITLERIGYILVLGAEPPFLRESRLQTFVEGKACVFPEDWQEFEGTAIG